MLDLAKELRETSLECLYTVENERENGNKGGAINNDINEL